MKKDETTRFVVGHNATATFSMLGYAGTSTGDGFVGSDLRHYDGITRTEAFELSDAKHAEFIAFYEYPIRREQRRISRSRQAKLLAAHAGSLAHMRPRPAAWHSNAHAE
jgi:hypothetical protein